MERNVFVLQVKSNKRHINLICRGILSVMDIVFVPLNSCRGAQEAMGACEGLVILGYKVVQLFSAGPVGNRDDCASAHTIFSPDEIRALYSAPAARSPYVPRVII